MNCQGWLSRMLATAALGLGLLGCRIESAGVSLGDAPVAASNPVESGAAKPGSTIENAVSLSNSGSPKELADGIGELLSASTGSDLDRLVSLSDCTAAMAAGWERVRRTMPETHYKGVVTPESLALSRFLRLIEGRLQVPLPKIWAESIKSARGYGPKNIWFPVSWDLVPSVEQRNKPWLLERHGAHWRVRNGSQVIKLPEEYFWEPASTATVKCDGEWAYVAVYSEQPDSKYILFAHDQGSGKIMWCSEVWGTSRIWPPGVIVGYSGSSWHVVTIDLTEETLVVFGISGTVVYVEVFDRKTGENRCRFSTAYSNEVPMIRTARP